MIIIEWGQYVPPVILQWGVLADPEQAEQAQNTETPIAVLIATSGTAAAVEWTHREW